MKTTTTKDINAFIESKGGSVSIHELKEFLSGTDSITNRPDNINPGIQQTNDQSPVYIKEELTVECELFDKFLKATRVEKGLKLSNAVLQERLEKLGISLEYLKRPIINKNGARMTCRITDKASGRTMLLRDYFADKAFFAVNYPRMNSLA